MASKKNTNYLQNSLSYRLKNIIKDQSYEDQTLLDKNLSIDDK